MERPDFLGRRGVPLSIRGGRLSVDASRHAVTGRVVRSSEAVEHGGSLFMQSSGPVVCKRCALAGRQKPGSEWHRDSLLPSQRS
jgi:hypothetical protein